ncbi:hypothetical protein I6A60_02000 [Frankia sp. AgB1.9]|uniref:hypothetical protein n=1 Tax=unclassified Frankia TaxID=2632575 RepID=UPI001934267A|nr:MULTISPECIES: hypothetical protein [unclassified Frankia]MBL7490475.1 hypothetical protein [Frankia sp. AgW1.1]MBL7546659.1 hypothetical protein [Frankia sp. AgB1.9]MBL7618180.1 hypothetical protein [Frankia sp. AgB1.8]
MSAGTIIAVLATIAAVGAWWAAQMSARAAATLTRIEQARWHTDLYPQLDITCRAQMSDRATLMVELTGPPGLHHLDSVTVAIRNDGLDHPPRAGGLTADQIAEQIWGPYRLVPGVDGTEHPGRTVTIRRVLLPGDSRPFALERTGPPTTVDRAGWIQRYENDPLRLTVTCRQGDQEWDVHRSVDVAPLATS